MCELEEGMKEGTETVWECVGGKEKNQEFTEEWRGEKESRGKEDWEEDECMRGEKEYMWEDVEVRDLAMKEVWLYYLLFQN